MRECEIGEIYRKEQYMYKSFKIIVLYIIFRCQECPIGKYSFVNPLYAEDCLRCPQNVMKCFKNQLFLKQG